MTETACEQQQYIEMYVESCLTFSWQGSTLAIQGFYQGDCLVARGNTFLTHRVLVRLSLQYKHN